MMGGLAYMTGPPGKPMRAGTSINDIAGGLFATIAILASLRERERTGRGGYVQSGLFETNMALVAQHMGAAAVAGVDPKPYGDPDMPKPWPIYDVFDTVEPGIQVHVSVVTETQWRAFCAEFGLHELLADPALATMRQIAPARPRYLPKVAAIFRTLTKADLMARCERLGIPYAPISKPSDLFEDPHLLAYWGGLLDVEMKRRKGSALRPARRRRCPRCPYRSPAAGRACAGSRRKRASTAGRSRARRA